MEEKYPCGKFGNRSGLSYKSQLNLRRTPNCKVLTALFSAFRINPVNSHFAGGWIYSDEHNHGVVGNYPSVISNG
jgi:hypothetical protein